jgi:hypothetical protein
MGDRQEFDGGVDDGEVDGRVDGGVDDEGADRASERAAARSELLPEERSVGSDDPAAQAAEILADSDRRTDEAAAHRARGVEHRSADDATPPT